MVWQKLYVMNCDWNVILNKCKHILLSHVRFRYPDDVKGFPIFIQSEAWFWFTWNLWRREEFPSLPEHLSSRCSYMLIFQGGKWLTESLSYMTQWQLYVCTAVYDGVHYGGALYCHNTDSAFVFTVASCVLPFQPELINRRNSCSSSKHTFAYFCINTEWILLMWQPSHVLTTLKM